MDEGIGQSITCPFTGCEVFVEETTVLKLVPDDKVVVRYQHLITNNFVEVRFCQKIEFSVMKIVHFSAINAWHFVRDGTATALSKWPSPRPSRSNVIVDKSFALDAPKTAMNRSGKWSNLVQ